MAKKTSSTVSKTNAAEDLTEDTTVVENAVATEEVAPVKKPRTPRKKAAASADPAEKKLAVKKAAVKRATRRRTTAGDEATAPVMKAFWGVFNPMMVQVAQYDYAQESEAQKAAADLTEKKKAPHFVQIIKKVV